MTSPLPDFLLEPLVRAALTEDLAPMGDATTRAVIPAGIRYTARLNAREPGVVSGVQIAALAFRLVDPALKVTTHVPDGSPITPADPIAIDFPEGDEIVDETAVAKLRRAMTDGVGVVRDAEGLKTALGVIAALEAGAESELLRNMLATATLIAAGALARHESRGGHFRADFPKPNPGMAHRTRMTLTEARAIRAAALEGT